MRDVIFDKQNNESKNTVYFSKTQNTNPLASTSERLVLPAGTKVYSAGAKNPTQSVFSKSSDTEFSAMTTEQRKQHNVQLTQNLFAGSEQPQETPKLPTAPTLSPAESLAYGFKYGLERQAQGLLSGAEGVVDALTVPLLYGASKLTVSNLLTPNHEAPRKENIVSETLRNLAEAQATGGPSKLYAESIEKRYQPTGVTKTAGDIVGGVAGMFPAAASGVSAANLARGGLQAANKTAQKIAPVVGRAIMGIGAAGQGIGEARTEGASLGKSILYGAGSGTLETAIESIAGGIPGLPKGVLNEVAKKITSSPVANTLINILGEGGEEALSTIVTPFLKRAVFNINSPFATASEIAQSAIMGMVASGVLQGASGNIDLRLSQQPSAINNPVMAAASAAGLTKNQVRGQLPQVSRPTQVGSLPTVQSPHMPYATGFNQQPRMPHASEFKPQSQQSQISLDPNVKPAPYIAQFGENTVGAARLQNPAQIARLPQGAASTTPTITKPMSGDGDNLSRTAGTLKGYTIFDEQFKKLATDDKGITTYEGITNKETMEFANDNLNAGGQGAVERWLVNRESTPENIATGIILMKRYQDIGDYEGMVRAMNHVRELSTQGAQTIQLMSLMGRMTPEGMAYYAQKSLSDAYVEMIQGKSKAWIDANKDKFQLSADDMDFIQSRTEQAARLPNGRDKNILLGEIAARMQNKIPPAAGQSAKALARISMLFNLKTNVRNVLGNAGVMPQHVMSDFVGSNVDKILSKTTGVRTTGIFQLQSVGSMGRGLYQSFDDFRRRINTREMGGDRFEIGQGLNFSEQNTGFAANQRNSLGKALNSLDRLTNFLLDAGDRPFYEMWFVNSLNNQMRLNSTTEATPAMIEIATTEALQRTWQDSNNYTDFVQSVRKGLNKLNVKGYGLGDVVMPFVKTPANLTKALIDYSPVGVVKALASDAVRFNNAVHTGQATPQLQKAYVKSLSQGITGTLLYAIFAGLASTGLIKGEGEKDKDLANFMRNIMGEQPYSVKIGDTSYSYAWAQPIAGMAAITADVVNSITTGKPKQYIVGGGSATQYFNIILSAIQSGGNVLYEQSFMQGLQNLFSQDNIVKGLFESITGEPAKFTPQFIAQLAQLADDTQRTSYVYGQPLQTAANKVKAKVPFLSQTLEPVVDVFGRDVKRNGGNNSITNVFLNPANVATENRTQSADEVHRLYEATGDTGIIPPTAPYYFDVDGKRYVMSPQQRTEYQRTTGQIADTEIRQLMQAPMYRRMSNSDKSKVLKSVYDYSVDVARAKVTSLGLSGTSGKIEKAKNKGLSPTNYFIIQDRYKKIYNSFEGEKSKASKQAATFESWVRLQGYTAAMTETILDTFKYYNMFPAK